MIADLNYAPDPAARNLCSGTLFVIGLVYDTPNPHHILNIHNGVLAACRETEFGLQIHPCDLTAPMLVDALAEWVQRLRQAGLVLTAPMFECPELIACGIKCVRIMGVTADPGDAACVYIVDCNAAYEITEHLIQLGHQWIGFLWGGFRHRCSGECDTGDEVALKDDGSDLDKPLVVLGDDTCDDDFRGACQLLVLRDQLTAIFGSNDEIAAGMLAAAKAVGIHVPQHLSIAGFEDRPFSSQSWPVLITARQAADEIACHTAHLLIGQLHIDTCDAQSMPLQNRGFVPQWVVHGSTAAVRQTSFIKTPSLDVP
ncbi:LacI family transcription regulator [Xylella taiwanensis]|uniref:LacI family transcription regulator n=1 Tax=Xylella taiwanensis TaxID=1444770 RepID=Z9JHX3_9GAMM|nr:LacI family transcription regulator [Xylella taiwanensis]